MPGSPSRQHRYTSSPRSSVGKVDQARLQILDHAAQPLHLFDSRAQMRRRGIAPRSNRHHPLPVQRHAAHQGHAFAVFRQFALRPVEIAFRSIALRSNGSTRVSNRSASARVKRFDMVSIG
jgi:hypothetical protein